MISYNFYNPTKLVFGDDTIKQIGSLIKANGYKKVLLIAGGGSIKKNGVYDEVIKSFQENEINWVENWGVKPNPNLDKVYECINLAKKEDVEAVVAVGGGSVIDTTKIVAAGVYCEDVWNVFERTERITKALPIFTVLTLSATASEMNCSAVITNEQEQKKWGTGHPLLFPKVSIIDPSAQNSLPWNQTVNGALDAMAHILEFYFMGTYEETVIAVNEALLNSIIKAVGKLKLKEDDTISRANLAWAATMALNGTSGAGLKGGDWSCHDMEHSISSLYPAVAHGAGLGVLFPAWMEYVVKSNPVQFERFSKNIWQCDELEDATEKFRKTIKTWQGVTKLRDLGVKEEDIELLAKMTTARGNIGRLQELNQKDVENILRSCY